MSAPPVTVHCHNWKSPRLVTPEGVKMVCNVRRPFAALAKTPQKITCDGCALRVLREGQSLGLSEDTIKAWTWEDLKAAPPPMEG